MLTLELMFLVYTLQLGGPPKILWLKGFLYYIHIISYPINDFSLNVSCASNDLFPSYWFCNTCKRLVLVHTFSHTSCKTLPLVWSYCNMRKHKLKSLLVYFSAEYIKPCQLSSPKLSECMIDSIHHLRPYLAKGKSQQQFSWAILSY